MTTDSLSRRFAPMLLLVVSITASGCASPLGIPEGYRQRAYEAATDPGPDLMAPVETPLDVSPLEDLTLERALELALQRNHTVAAAKETVRATIARIAEARAAFLPTISGTIGRTFNKETTTVTVGGGQTFNISPKNTTTARGNITMSLFAFGRDLEQLLASQANVSTEIFNERAIRQELLFAVTQAWLACHLADSDVVVAQDSLAASERQLKDAENVYEAGRQTRDAVLTAQVNKLRSQQELITAENAQRQSRRVLNTLLSRDVDAKLVLAPAPEFRPAIVNPKRLTALARQHNPTLMAFRSNRQSLEHQRESLERSFAPELVGDLGASYSDFRDASGFATNYTANVSLTWTPVNAGLRIGRINEIHALLAQLREQEIQTVLDIGLGIEETVEDLAEFESQFRLATEAVAAARENYRIISDRFRAGRTTSREVLDAQVTLSDSRNSLSRAIVAHEVELARLESFVGVARDAWLQEGR